MDACLPLTSTFSAIMCGLTEDGEILVDPDLQQEGACHSTLTFVLDNVTEEFLMSHANGGFSMDQVCGTLLIILYGGCNREVPSYREIGAILQYYSDCNREVT
jgi:ribonuclease PH